MTESEIRGAFAARAESFLGAKKGSARHHEIVDAYNSYLPHPRGHALTYSDDWCAAFVSACAILQGLTGIIPVECSCGEQIRIWQEMGRWEERDDHIPSVGDVLYYDWQDDGAGDNAGAADHVGIVASVGNGLLHVVEGNKGTSSIVGYRWVNVDGRYVRGFGLPDFASVASEGDNGANSVAKVETGFCTPQVQIVQYGAKSEAVRALQALLNLRSAVGLARDGSFGPATLRAVKAFQAVSGIETDGSVGPVTWGRLLNG